MDQKLFAMRFNAFTVLRALVLDLIGDGLRIDIKPIDNRNDFAEADAGWRNTFRPAECRTQKP